MTSEEAASRSADPQLGLPAALSDRFRQAPLGIDEPAACDDLPGVACTLVPGNAARNVVSGVGSVVFKDVIPRSRPRPPAG